MVQTVGARLTCTPTPLLLLHPLLQHQQQLPLLLLLPASRVLDKVLLLIVLFALLGVVLVLMDLPGFCC